MEHQAALNTLDLVVFGILLLSGLLAFMRGFVREVFALGTWAGSGLASLYLYPYAKPFVEVHLKSDLGSGLATACGLFCLGLTILIPLSNALAGMVKGESLTAIDRSLGFVFGLLRGGLILSLLFLCATIIWPDKDGQNTMPNLLAQARTRPMLTIGAETLKGLLPEDMDSKAAAHLEAKEKAAEDIARAATGIDLLATPKPAEKPADKKEEPLSVSTTPKPQTKPSQGYSTEERNGLNALIEKKAQ